jgi:hypothetical protein
MIMEPRRILVVANQTACGRELLDTVKQRMSRGPSTLTLVVPATPPDDQLTWSDGGAKAVAEYRLQEALEHFRAEGIEADGVVGDANPVLAVGDLLLDRSFDEIILSTLPAGLSRWLKMDLPHRIEHKYGLPVTSIVGAREALTTHDVED